MRIHFLLALFSVLSHGIDAEEFKTKTVTEIKTLTEVPTIAQNEIIIITKTLIKTVGTPIPDQSTLLYNASNEPKDQEHSESLGTDTAPKLKNDDITESEKVNGSKLDSFEEAEQDAYLESEDKSGEEFGYDPNYFASRLYKSFDLSGPETDEIVEKLHADLSQTPEDAQELEFENHHHNDQSTNEENPEHLVDNKDGSSLFPNESDFVFDHNPTEEQISPEHAEFEKIEEDQQESSEFDSDLRPGSNTSSEHQGKGSKNKQVVDSNDVEFNHSNSTKQPSKSSSGFIQGNSNESNLQQTKGNAPFRSVPRNTFKAAASSLRAAISGVHMSICLIVLALTLGLLV